MSASRCALIFCVCVLVVLHTVTTVDARRRRRKRDISSNPSDYVKVFIGYMGEIPMTEDIKRMEANLPLLKKKKIEYLKKSLEYAKWLAGDYGSSGQKPPAPPRPPPPPIPPPPRPIIINLPVTKPTTTTRPPPTPRPTTTKKPVYFPPPFHCSQEVDLAPFSVTYVRSEKAVHTVDLQRMKGMGFIMGRTILSSTGGQMKDAMEVTFRQPVHIREVEFAGEHNVVTVSLRYKQGKKWQDVKGPDNRLQVLEVAGDEEADVVVPPTQAVRVYPQRFSGHTPFFHGIQFSGCK